ncbi:MAG: sporulation protein YqfD [Clostridiales bacterium]|nr:sporulation protein YqfD [Clostridiales bacterium]
MKRRDKNSDTQKREKKPDKRTDPKKRVKADKSIDIKKKREAERLKREEKARKVALKREMEEKRRKQGELKAERPKVRFAARHKVYRKIKSKRKNDPRGFDYRNYGFLPRVELNVRGDGASVAARFSAAGIVMREVVAGGGFLRFKIRKKDLRKAVAILNELCYNFEVGESYGIGRFGWFLLARLGIIIGTAAAAVALNISYSHIWRFDISGNAVISNAAIESVLRDAGFVSGIKKTDVDTDAVCAAVNGLDGVSDAGAEIVGTTLYVYVLEAKDFTVHKKYEAYESAYDATVTRIVMRSGTARVKCGDIVKRGDVLADGDVYSTADELLYTGECDADIYGNVSLTITAEIGNSYVEYERTGRTEKRTCFTLFGHRMFNPAPSFKSYESVATTANYDVLIPLYVTTYEYYETKPVEKERDIDEAAKAFAESKAKELEFVGDFETSYTVKATDTGLYRVNLFLSGEALISRGAPRRLPPTENGETPE